MVEYSLELDDIFAALADPTRRDILERLGGHGMSVGAIARHYDFSFAGVAKHLDVLERAGLVRKTRRGREQIVTIDPRGLAAAGDYLELYRRFATL